MQKNEQNDSSQYIQTLMNYFSETAYAVSLEACDDNDAQPFNILGNQYRKINCFNKETALFSYFNEKPTIEKLARPKLLIYPFGANDSQKCAVENAFSSQVSIIQGPPGTGKTQTILNIIANALLSGKTVAVVSNNNSAIDNIRAKLKQYDLDFICAFLGSSYNKNSFLQAQSGLYPDMTSWKAPQRTLIKDIEQLSQKLDFMFRKKNRLSDLESELRAIKLEFDHFNIYCSEMPEIDFVLPPFSGMTSQKSTRLWCSIEAVLEKHEKISIFSWIKLAFSFGPSVLKLLRYKNPNAIIQLLQQWFYQRKIEELEREKYAIEMELTAFGCDEKLQELQKKSLALLHSCLEKKYNSKKAKNNKRRLFSQYDLRDNSDVFNREYPIILSTTYSIKSTLDVNHTYDYLIVDESSQVDLVTGVLALSCAKNIVIVGDQKQLPNVLPVQTKKLADSIFFKYKISEAYRFSENSLLDSALKIWKNAPSVLLREHYRCHPKIAGFFNQKFYENRLRIMTKDSEDKNVLSVFLTVCGSHARGHVNQRQIDVIQQEILPFLLNQGIRDVGIIAPYRDQVASLRQQFGKHFEIATVHKFQGREKDAIIISTVDNKIGSFVDNPNLMNVAVSRAKKYLAVVISQDKENEYTNYGDLVKYIRYNNFQITKSNIRSIFDFLYKEHNQDRTLYLKNRRRVSEYLSENLAYSIIEKVLQHPECSNISCSVHVALRTIVRNYAILTEKEAKYARNPWTHIDFLFFNKMDKLPLLALEIDGTRFHQVGSKQAERDELKNSILSKIELPLLRIRTDESGEYQKILTALKAASHNQFETT